MKKAEAIALFGDTQATADALGITYAAVAQWPVNLPERIADRVRGAAWRLDKLSEAEKPKQQRAPR